MTDLFTEEELPRQDLSGSGSSSPYRPLADRMRPETLADYIGQEHLLGEGKLLTQAIENQAMHSMVFWGPPGTGKTTLAHIISNTLNAHFISLSAVLSGVKDIRDAISQAEEWRGRGVATILFVDEVHRFNKSQQDAFLPYVENGTIYFIGATTENPSFELNNALLSRVKTYVLKTLTAEHIRQLLQRAVTRDERLAEQNIEIDESALDMLAQVADGDARRALNFLEIACDLAEEKGGDDDTGRHIGSNIIEDVTAQSLRRFDKGGDLFYEQISALHKSVRGSDPDASLYWFARMIDGGCDPLYVARRVVRMASEDIGNADPRGLHLALDAWHTYERLGSPEGELAIAQAIVYLACTAKSNAVYMAYKMALRDAADSASLDVPEHLRNAPTSLMKDMGYGKDYRYAHDEDDAFAAGVNYFPESMADTRYYEPVSRGLEKQIAEKLADLRERNRLARKESGKQVGEKDG